MSIKVKDMDKVEALSGSAMLQLGRHYVSIASAVEGKSSGGWDQVEITFVSEAGIGQIRDWITFAESTVPGKPSFAVRKAKALLEAVMIESEGGEWEFPTDKLQGRKLWIIVGEEEDYSDSTKMRRVVQAYEAVSASDVPADTRDLPGTPVADKDELPF